MWLRQLEIQHLRNLERVSITLCSGLNFFLGDNGAGKTAILEAVHLLARGRSFRTQQTMDLVQRGQSRLTVRGVLEDEHRGELSVGHSRARGGRAELRINGLTGRRLSQVAELLPVQLMGPEVSDLVFGSPSGRRQWLDWGVFHVEHDHLRALREFMVALRQRNAVLKAASGRVADPRELAVWSEELAGLAETVTTNRNGYLLQLAPVLNATLAQLAPDLVVEARYRPGWPEGQPLRKVLGDSAAREVKSGATLFGPHRADVELRVDGLPAAPSLSRGQGKALASAMMLAQALLLQRNASRSSVFLIDDIGAELDANHAIRFFALLGDLGAQVLATSNTVPETLRGSPDGPRRMFHVEHGRVRAAGGEALDGGPPGAPNDEETE